MLTLAAVFAASPAAAQFPNIFDAIFGNPPPRPPGDVPGYPPSSVPSEPQYIPPPGGLPPGPPPRRPSYSGGPRGGVQTQTLPPPPGAVSAPPAARGAPPDGRPRDAQSGQPSDQRQPRGVPPGTSAALHPTEEVVTPSLNKIANPTAVFAGLDKITGRIISFDVAINETVRFGALEVTPRACYSRPPTDPPNTDGFVAVDELTLQGELRRIFTGWMFAASPGLSAVEHPIYDIWLTDCKGGAQPTVTAETPPEPAPPKRPPPRRRATQQTPALPPPLR